MKISRFIPNDDFDIFELTKKISLEESKTFNGSKKADNWIPLEVKKMQPYKLLEIGDINYISYISSLPVFSKKAVNVLKHLLEPAVEILPLIYNEGEYYLINVLDVLDCIDYEKSRYSTFSDGRVAILDEYVFKEETIVDRHIFKIKDEPLSKCFVSEEIRRLVEKNELKGSTLKLVWDSEENK